MAYSTATDFNTFLGTIRDLFDIASIADAEKTKALEEATIAIDRLNFEGDKAVSTQTNEFPRTGFTTVPDDVVMATHFIAYALLSGKDIELEAATIGNVSSSLSGTGVREAKNYKHIAFAHGIPSARAWYLLKPFLRDGDSFALMRVS